MQLDENEEKLLRSVALQNERAVLLARERAERELVQANERITNILDSITDGFVSFDKEWRIIFLNRRGEEILRPLYKSKEKLLGMNLWEAFPDIVGTPIEAHYRQAMRDQVTVQFEIFYAPLKVWFDIRAYPTPDGLSVYFLDINQRKVAEEEARHQREWFQVTLSSIGDAVITTDTESKVTFLNPVAEAMTGWKVGEVPGQPLEKVFNIINEHTRLSVENPIAKVLREGIIIELANHTALIARDGSVRAIEDSAAPITDATGKILGAVLVFHDVSDKRGIQNALRESEQRLRAMFNQAAVGMAIAGMNGRFEEVNQKFSDILDYSAKELSALTFLEVTYPTDLPQTEKEVGRLLAGEIADYSLEKRYIRKDGAIVWVFCTVTLLRDEAGMPNQFVGVIEDITQRKKAEERLRSSEEELRALADSIPQLAWVAEPGGSIFWYNKRWFDYTGTTLPQMEGWGWQSVHDPEKLPLVVERWKASINTGEPFEMEFPLRGADGVFRWFLTRVIPVRNADGHITRWFGTNTDLDEIRKTRQELQKAKDELEDRVRERTASLQETTQQLETFCYTIAHDLRSPLRAQQGFALALLDEYQNALGETGKDYAQRIIAAAKRLDQLVSDLLSYSRLSRTDLHFEKVDLAKVVRDVQAIFAEEIANKNATISIGELAPVLAHEATLNIVISNLMTNALKFMAPGVGPRIRIWAEQKNTFVRLWVEDNGIGINPEHQPKIFGVFQRLHPMDTYPGTGIGLALVQKGVERMGGSVGIESAPGEGSRFWIELPHAP